MLVCEDCGREITGKILDEDTQPVAYCSFCDEWINVVTYIDYKNKEEK